MLDEDELQDELDKLDEMIAEDAIPSAPDTVIASTGQKQPAKKVVEPETGSKRQLVHA